MNLEREILKKVSLNNSFIHDDCAYLKNSQQLISTDTLVENVHFNLKIFSATQIAHRLFICSFSDIQSSGGYPQYALLNISFPNKNFAFIITRIAIKFINSSTTVYIFVQSFMKWIVVLKELERLGGNEKKPSV